MLGFAQEFLLKYEAYLSTRDRKEYPRPPYTPSNLGVPYVRSGDIGMCPLKAWHKRNGTPETFPESRASLFSANHKMTQGEIDARPFVDALLDHYGDASEQIQAAVIEAASKKQYLEDYTGQFQGSARAGAEISISGKLDEVMISGRMDAWVAYEDQAGRIYGVPVEVKRSDPPNYNRGGENGVLYPRPYQLYQLGSYMHLTDTYYGCLALLARYGAYVWEVSPEGIYGFYMIGDGIKQIEWDDAEMREAHKYVQFDEIYARASEAIHYMNIQDEADLPLTPPIADPLDHPQGWLCGKIRGEKPKTLKTDPQNPLAIMRDDPSPDNSKRTHNRWLVPGEIEWSCPYGCHARNGEKTAMVYKDGKKTWLAEQ